jgi:hypothetical protein
VAPAHVHDGHRKDVVVLEELRISVSVHVRLHLQGASANQGRHRVNGEKE